MASGAARAELLCAISSKSTPASSRWLRWMNFVGRAKSIGWFSIKRSKTSASTPRNLTRSSRSAVRTDSFRILSVANGALTSDPGLLPAWARVCGWLFLIGQTLFISRIVYESTVLTCVDGPQMVGFSMAHGGHSFFLLGLLFRPFRALFFLVALVFGALKRLRFTLREWVLMAALLVRFSFLFVPYRVWEHFDMTVCTSGL